MPSPRKALAALSYLKSILKDDADNLGRQFSASGIQFDNKDGLAAIPYGADINYFGGGVMMRPSEFLSIAKPLNSDRISPWIRGTMDPKGGTQVPVASPILFLDDIMSGMPRVSGHEGRNRMRWLMENAYDNPVPVLFKDSVTRARNLTPEVLEQLKRGNYKTERDEMGLGFGNGAAVIGRKFENYANGGLVAGNNAFSPKNGFLKGGLGIIHSKSRASGPLNVGLNTNNMMAKARAHG